MVGCHALRSSLATTSNRTDRGTEMSRRMLTLTLCFSALPAFRFATSLALQMRPRGSAYAMRCYWVTISDTFPIGVTRRRDRDLAAFVLLKVGCLASTSTTSRLQHRTHSVHVRNGKRYKSEEAFTGVWIGIDDNESSVPDFPAPTSQLTPC